MHNQDIDIIRKINIIAMLVLSRISNTRKPPTQFRT